MFAILSVMAAIQLAVACNFFPLGRRHSVWGAVCLMGGILFAAFLSLLSPLLFIQCVALLVTGFICHCLGTNTRRFLAAGTIVTAAIFLAVGLQGVLECSALKQRFPMESLASRLAYEVEPAGGAAHEPLAAELTPDALARLDGLYQMPVVYRVDRRNRALAFIHASRVQQFVDSPGFGIGRMLPEPSWVLNNPLPEPEPIPSDELPAAPETSAAAVAPGAAAQGALRTPTPSLFELASAHGNAQVDFANGYGFGYVEDREHVAGFEPHRFSRLPNQVGPECGVRGQELRQSWAIRRVELVSLLKHQKPMVYISKNLPRMDELRNAPVRPLDQFEEESLPALRAGGNIQTRDEGGRIRMLGAIRAARQCLDCHAVKHGALLGAFSYELELRQPGGPRPPALNRSARVPLAPPVLFQRKELAVETSGGLSPTPLTTLTPLDHPIATSPAGMTN